MSTKYSGYRPYTERQSVLTWAPGQSASGQHARFHTREDVCVRESASVEAHPASEYARTTSHVTRDNFEMPPAASTVTLLPMEKPCDGTSVHRSAFAHAQREGQQLRDLSRETLAAAFAGVDTRSEGFALGSEVTMIVRRALATSRGTLTDRQERVLEGLALRKPGGWRAQWSLEEVCGVVAEAAAYLDREVHVLRPDVARSSITIASRHRETQEATLRGLPSAASASSGRKTLVLHGAAPRPSYVTDFGGPGEGPQTRPLKDEHAAGLFQTTRDLLGGTTRQSQHVPGYQGHIPSHTHTAAGKQGLGQTVRDSFHAKTNLAVTFTRRVPGYSGYLPDFDVSDSSKVNKPGGQFAATEALAADHLVTQYWEARRAAGAATSLK